MSDAKVNWNPDTLVDSIADVNGRLGSIEAQLGALTLTVMTGFMVFAALYVVKGRRS